MSSAWSSSFLVGVVVVFLVGVVVVFLVGVVVVHVVGVVVVFLVGVVVVLVGVVVVLFVGVAPTSGKWQRVEQITHLQHIDPVLLGCLDNVDQAFLQAETVGDHQVSGVKQGCLA